MCGNLLEAPGQAALAGGSAGLAPGWLGRLVLQGLVLCAHSHKPLTAHGNLRVKTVRTTETVPPGTMVTFWVGSSRESRPRSAGYACGPSTRTGRTSGSRCAGLCPPFTRDNRVRSQSGSMRGRG